MGMPALQRTARPGGRGTRAGVEKVGQAASRYERKYGTAPDMCYVHPSVLKDQGPRKVAGVRVAALPSVLRHHFWLGREAKRARKPRPNDGGVR